jgi:hypothetical protein
VERQDCRGRPPSLDASWPNWARVETESDIRGSVAKATACISVESQYLTRRKATARNVQYGLLFLLCGGRLLIPCTPLESLEAD